MQNIRVLYLKFFRFLELNSIYFKNRRVFVMATDSYHGIISKMSTLFGKKKLKLGFEVNISLRHVNLIRDVRNEQIRDVRNAPSHVNL